MNIFYMLWNQTESELVCEDQYETLEEAKAEMTAHLESNPEDEVVIMVSHLIFKTKLEIVSDILTEKGK